jgi:REP element-mobilizing transposase RayT
MQWLFEAKKRYGLSILNFMVTSNHIHLLVVDGESDAISRSIQLIAGRTAQQFNRRKGRNGAFWEDRYHATAIERGEHLLRCLVYIDMNMVRAGAVSHPSEWLHCGYHEIQQMPSRYRLIDRECLIGLCGMQNDQQLVAQHRDWIEQQVQVDTLKRDTKWSESVAVGGAGFAGHLQQQLGIQAAGRKVREAGDAYVLREPEISWALTGIDPLLLIGTNPLHAQ